MSLFRQCRYAARAAATRGCTLHTNARFALLQDLLDERANAERRIVRREDMGVIDGRRGEQLRCHVVLLSDVLLIMQHHRSKFRLLTLVWLAKSHLVDGSIASGRFLVSQCKPHCAASCLTT
jgi:hypothetical protein